MLGFTSEPKLVKDHVQNNVFCSRSPSYVNEVTLNQVELELGEGLHPMRKYTVAWKRGIDYILKNQCPIAIGMISNMCLSRFSAIASVMQVFHLLLNTCHALYIFYSTGFYFQTALQMDITLPTGNKKGFKNHVPITFASGTLIFQITAGNGNTKIHCDC